MAASYGESGPLTFFERLKAGNVMSQNSPESVHHHNSNENMALRPNAKPYAPFQLQPTPASEIWNSHDFSSSRGDVATKVAGNALHDRPALERSDVLGGVPNGTQMPVSQSIPIQRVCFADKNPNGLDSKSNTHLTEGVDMMETITSNRSVKLSPVPEHSGEQHKSDESGLDVPVHGISSVSTSQVQSPARVIARGPHHKVAKEGDQPETSSAAAAPRLSSSNSIDLHKASSPVAPSSIGMPAIHGLGTSKDSRKTLKQAPVNSDIAQKPADVAFDFAEKQDDKAIEQVQATFDLTKKQDEEAIKQDRVAFDVAKKQVGKVTEQDQTTFEFGKKQEGHIFAQETGEFSPLDNRVTNDREGVTALQRSIIRRAKQNLYPSIVSSTQCGDLGISAPEVKAAHDTVEHKIPFFTLRGDRTTPYVCNPTVPQLGPGSAIETLRTEMQDLAATSRLVNLVLNNFSDRLKNMDQRVGDLERLLERGAFSSSPFTVAVDFPNGQIIQVETNARMKLRDLLLGVRAKTGRQFIQCTFMHHGRPMDMGSCVGDYFVHSHDTLSLVHDFLPPSSEIKAKVNGV